MEDPTTATQANPPTRSQGYHFLRASNQHKFTTQLEFLSLLSSPSYLVHLSSQGHLRNPSFIRYLSHLRDTWSQPQYARFLRYPNALVMLDALVGSREFREAVGREGWEWEMKGRILGHWSSWRNDDAEESTLAPPISTASAQPLSGAPPPPSASLAPNGTATVVGEPTVSAGSQAAQAQAQASSSSHFQEEGAGDVSMADA